jgi:hypothetical protein
MRTQAEMQRYINRHWPKERALVELPGPSSFVPSKESLARCKKDAQQRRYHEWQLARKPSHSELLHWPYPWFYENGETQ